MGMVYRKRAPARPSRARASRTSRPFPATVMLERPERQAEGAPNPDPAKAAEFFQRTVDTVEAALRDVFAGWAEIGRS